MADSTQTSIARVEERVIALTHMVRGYHEATTSEMRDTRTKVETHAEQITILKRNWWWMVTLGGVAVTLLGAWISAK